MLEEITSDKLIEEIVAVLAEADGEFLANIANRVITPRIEYNEDTGNFTVFERK